MHEIKAENEHALLSVTKNTFGIPHGLAEHCKANTHA